ncbi:MAG: AI-2E family transporter [Roseiflexaceae bacterium]|nr:AI-2E family transporter [Roseiflexaceae bacterium]
MARTFPATPPEQSPVPPEAATPTNPTMDPNEPLRFSMPSWRTLARWALCLSALYGVAWLLWRAGSALTPFIIGLVLAFLLTPFVNRLANKMPRWLAILTVYVAGTVLVVVGFSYIVPPAIDQVRELLGNLPNMEQAQQIFGNLVTRYRQTVPPALQEQLDPAIAGGFESVRQNVGVIAQETLQFILAQISNVVTIASFTIGFLIIPIWLFYVLNDQKEGRNFIDSLLHHNLRPDFWNTWAMVNKVFSDYVRGQLVLCVAVGVAVGLGLLSLRLFGIEVQYILLLAIIAGITEFIPVLGPIIGSVPGIIIALFTAGPQGALAALVVYVIVQQLENNFLVPRIVGESVGVHPAILTVVLIAMGSVFGILGVVLSAPLAAIARDLFVYVYDRLGGVQPAGAMAHVNSRAKTENPQPRSLTGEVKAGL